MIVGFTVYIQFYWCFGYLMLLTPLQATVYAHAGNRLFLTMSLLLFVHGDLCVDLVLQEEKEGSRSMERARLL